MFVDLFGRISGDLCLVDCWFTCLVAIELLEIVLLFGILVKNEKIESR